jgi:hypothetical protein
VQHVEVTDRRVGELSRIDPVEAVDPHRVEPVAVAVLAVGERADATLPAELVVDRLAPELVVAQALSPESRRTRRPDALSRLDADRQLPGAGSEIDVGLEPHRAAVAALVGVSSWRPPLRRPSNPLSRIIPARSAAGRSRRGRRARRAPT